MSSSSSGIPIRNIYYLLCYAWNRMEHKDLVDVSTDGVTELVDLSARVLIHSYKQLKRRMLEQSYRVHEEEIPFIRGRLDLVNTHRRLLDWHGRAFCRFDELSPDTTQNRVIKAAALRLIRVKSLNKCHREQLARMAREMTSVTSLPLTTELLSQIHLHSNNRHYGFIMNMARLIHLCAIPDEKAGAYQFMDFVRSRRTMARLFEDFIFNFLTVERPDLKVSRDQIPWEASSEDDPELMYLPTMRTDVTIRTADKTVVIDAKYYEETFLNYYDATKLRSAHLYQLLAYLTNMASEQGINANVDGMLIYPVVSSMLNTKYCIQGHAIRVRTLDLGQDWRRIEQDLKTLV